MRRQILLGAAFRFWLLIDWLGACLSFPSMFIKLQLVQTQINLNLDLDGRLCKLQPYPRHRHSLEINHLFLSTRFWRERLGTAVNAFMTPSSSASVVSPHSPVVHRQSTRRQFQGLTVGNTHSVADCSYSRRNAQPRVAIPGAIS
jgi:hypothetical protein